MLNARDVPSRARAASLDAPPLWFGEGEPELPGVWLSDAQSLQLWEGSQPRTIAVAIPFAGAHNRANLAAAIAGALLVGVPIERIVEGIPHLALPHGRYESIALDGFARIIYDAYNANESGTLAALDAFASEPGDRRIAILASMAELGEEAEAMHARVGARAANVKVDVLLVGGEYARAMESGARAAGLPPERIVPFSSNGEAAAWVRAHSSRRDVVLLKGSRKYRMEEIVQELRG